MEDPTINEAKTEDRSLFELLDEPIIRRFSGDICALDLMLKDHGEQKEIRPYDEEGEKIEEEEEEPELLSRRELVTVIASAPTPDRYNDIVEPNWNLERFMANPIVPWAHNYNIPPVGRVESLEVNPLGMLIAQIRFDTSEENDLGRLVAKQFEDGFLNAVSVGFAPGEVVPRASLPEDHPAFGATGNLYREPELLEISAVPIPAHGGALALRSIQQPVDESPELLRSIPAVIAGPENSTGHIIEVREDDETLTVVYAKMLPKPEQEEPEDPSTEETTMRALFGKHPLETLFGRKTTTTP